MLTPPTDGSGKSAAVLRYTESLFVAVHDSTLEDRFKITIQVNGKTIALGIHQLGAIPSWR